MLKVKHSLTESNPININSDTVSSNNYENIRTLKSDLENLKSGKKDFFEEPVSQSPIPQTVEVHPQAQSKTETVPPSFEQKFSSPETSATLKEKTFTKTEKENQKKDIPNPFGSETFFQTQSPFEEKIEVLKKEPEKAPKKFSNKLIFILFSLFIFAILGSGTYYWWFFMRFPQKESVQKTLTTADQETTAKNSNLKQWSLDLKSDKIANKLTIERYVKNLASEISSEKAVEIKIVSKDNQPIPPEVFSEIFDFTFPISISGKLTSDYSLFVFCENSEPHLGAAFKLTHLDNLAEFLKSEEKDLFFNLKSFYLDKPPADIQTAFNSSKYKNTDIRYFNFPSPTNTSLDYTILSNKENSYFIFSTSKNSLRAILDYMSEK